MTFTSGFVKVLLSIIIHVHSLNYLYACFFPSVLQWVPVLPAAHDTAVYPGWHCAFRWDQRHQYTCNHRHAVTGGGR